MQLHNHSKLTGSIQLSSLFEPHPGVSCCLELCAPGPFSGISIKGKQTTRGTHMLLFNN